MKDTSCLRKLLTCLPATGETSQAVLFWAFVTATVTFPLGQFFREAGPIICIAILAHNIIRFPGTVRLHHFPLKTLFIVFYALILFKMFHSVAVTTSLKTVYPNFWKGFTLVFIGYEAIASMRQLRIFIAFTALTAVFQGLDGVWQAVTGRDFINKTPIMYGRLTGSMSTYRVGDYMAMLLVPSLGIVTMWPRSWSTMRRNIVTLLILSPALYLLVFAQSRSGYAGCITGAYLVYIVFLTRPTLPKIALPPLLTLVFILFGPSRISIETALNDQRFDLWRLAWEVFKTYPLLGAGAGAYNPAFTSLGLRPVAEDPGIQHPHNIYLQFLCDTGIIGTTIALTFFTVVTVWTARRIWKGMNTHSEEQRHHYRLTAFVWGGWVCYLVNAFGAHDFYRTWWLAVAMTLLGCLLGAVSVVHNRSPG